MTGIINAVLVCQSWDRLTKAQKSMAEDLVCDQLDLKQAKHSDLFRVSMFTAEAKRNGFRGADIIHEQVIKELQERQP